MYNESQVSVELLTAYDLPANEEKTEEVSAEAEETVQEEVSSIENKNTLSDRQESIMSEKGKLGVIFGLNFRPMSSVQG